MKTKNNNKGFSLVELIVVVAIMAVLVGVLAPAYLSYVEKTRLQKDNSAIGEICAAIQTAMADEEAYNEAATTPSMLALSALLPSLWGCRQLSCPTPSMLVPLQSPTSLRQITLLLYFYCLE